MFKAILFAAVIPTLTVLADISPLEPAPGNVYNQGSACDINWATDTTGQWTTMNIELMTGSNEDMVHLTTVATVDGTKETSHSWTCPTVSPNAAIYFYQFSTPAAPGNLLWTGRFAIADSNGKSTDPTDEADGVKFGTGALSDPSSASAAPSYLNGGAVSTTVESGASSGTTQSVISTSATGALTATGSLTTSRTTSRTSDTVNQASASDSASDSAPSSTSTASGAIALAVDFKARALQAFAGLIGTAFVFSTVF